MGSSSIAWALEYLTLKGGSYKLDWLVRPGTLLGGYCRTSVESKFLHNHPYSRIHSARYFEAVVPIIHCYPPGNNSLFVDKDIVYCNCPRAPLSKIQTVEQSNGQGCQILQLWDYIGFL